MRIFEDDDYAIVKSTMLEGKDIIIREGDVITIDGLTGHVYRGHHKTRKKQT